MVIEEHAALDVITKDGSTYAIDESHIIRGSLTTSQSCSSGGGIPAGSCNTGTASVAFHAPSALSYEKLFGAKVKLYVWYGDTSKKQVGVYNVTSTERSYGVYTLSLSDNVYLLDEACYSNDKTTAAQNWLAMQLGEKKIPSVIFNMICNAYSVPHWNAAKNEKAVPESGISALSVKVPSDCCTESVKDFANYIAEYLGAIIMPDENGELHFSYMGSRTCPITIDASNIERGTYQKAPFHVSTSSWRVNHDSGIWSEWRVVGDLPDNAAPLSIVVNNNPFWQSVEDETPESMVRGRTETMLRYMWVAQGKVAYIDNVPQINPFRCTVHVPYYFRAGDRVKIIDPFTSYVYHSYVTDVTWTFRGGHQISCAGEDTRTLSVSTSRNGAKKMSDYSRYLYRKSKSNTGSVEANTYTKAEIDAKDAAVKSAADKAQGTADGAVSVNNTQNTQIAALKKSAHTHSNKSVLDKTEQPYTTAERDKLAGLENYTHPTHTSHSKGMYKFANDGLGHVSDAEEVTKQDIVDLGIPGSIPIYNVYVDEEYGYSEGMIIATIVVNQTAHPIVVPIIGENENADYGLMSASDKTKLDGIADNANNYVHPTTSGNKHIPSGGASGQILRWSADGTAVWGADNDTTYNDATQSAHGLMTAADKKKLDGMDLSKYLPKSGGVMTGAIDTVTNGVDITVGSNKSNNSNPTLVAGGSYEVPDVYTNALKNYKSLIGSYHNTKTGAWFNMISVRHRNGYDDGANYGMYLYSALTSDGNLIWNKQTAKDTWQGNRVLLDSVNFTDYAAYKNHTHQYVPWIAMGGSGTKALYGIFASLSDTNPTLNQGATLLITDAGDFVSGQTGAWLVQISNRNNKPWMTITTLIPHAAGDVQFGYYHDTANKLFYFGVYTTPYRSSLVVSTLRNDAAIIKNFTSYGSEPIGWTVVNPQYDITKATTLTDSGWIATTRDTTFTVTSTVKCRKYGQLVEVRGEATFKSTYGSTTVCTLPAGYRPATVVQACGITPNGKQYMIKADTSGVISFGSDSGSTFVKGTTYRIDLTYLLG